MYTASGDVRTKLAEDLFRCKEQFEYSRSGQYVIRTIHLPDELKIQTQIPLDSNAISDSDAQSAFDYTFLRMTHIPEWPKNSQIVRVVDLFCGCGGLSLGAMEACRAMQKGFLPVLALDKDPIAIKVYNRNFQPNNSYVQDIVCIFDGNIGSELTNNECNLLKKIGTVDILLAGPPCQGYSSLNNFTRQNDDRNSLYGRVARFVEMVKPEHVLIENVPAVIHGKEKVVGKTIQLMHSLGYNVDADVIDLSLIGVPQKRKRHVLVASTSKSISVSEVIRRHGVDHPRSVHWAIADIEGELPNSILNTPTRHSEDNMQRIKYLHQEKLYDLPNELRPPCHRSGNHGYKSMYGRMKINEPAQTITSGFLSPGQGRFIHPMRPRTITPHEAARLQFLPDFFDFSPAKTRKSLSSMIGNVAPMKLSYVFCLDFLA